MHQVAGPGVGPDLLDDALSRLEGSGLRLAPLARQHLLLCCQLRAQLVHRNRMLPRVTLRLIYAWCRHRQAPRDGRACTVSTPRISRTRAVHVPRTCRACAVHVPFTYRAHTCVLRSCLKAAKVCWCLGVETCRIGYFGPG